MYWDFPGGEVAKTLCSQCKGLGLIASRDFPGGSDSKESACNAGDLGSIPGSGRSPGEGNGYPLQYSCLENSMDMDPGGLQSMQSRRIRHNLVTNNFTFRELDPIHHKDQRSSVPKLRPEEAK